MFGRYGYIIVQIICIERDNIVSSISCIGSNIPTMVGTCQMKVSGGLTLKSWSNWIITMYLGDGSFWDTKEHLFFFAEKRFNATHFVQRFPLFLPHTCCITYIIFLFFKVSIRNSKNVLAKTKTTKKKNPYSNWMTWKRWSIITCLHRHWLFPLWLIVKYIVLL